ncbi:putative RNA-directed DNA polymerase [Rosa chinensis]|uniref:Putative RNA-directed DNA polymerase n=1 Tax=Rosa chinensis TaxID=74649 RepID=A0A2P6SHK8_ROSCH|nr:putative RNA-directed DNA polymerase [Rosa chinensis]
MEHWKAARKLILEILLLDMWILTMVVIWIMGSLEQDTPALSTTEAEYMATAEAVKEILWLHGLMNELGISQNQVEVHCDSQRAIYLGKYQVCHARTKHINVHYHMIREEVEKGRIALVKICTENNPTDMLTKLLEEHMELFDVCLARMILVKIYIFIVTDRMDHSVRPSVQHNCRIEYNVEPCSNVDTVNDQCLDNQWAMITMPIDGYIVYGKGFSLCNVLSVTGLLVYDDVRKDRILCSSIPIYGQSEEVRDEAGYIVGMSTCPHLGTVKIKDGDTLVVGSNYSSSQPHTRVMGASST